jgi:hypothetical protein
MPRHKASQKTVETPRTRIAGMLKEAIGEDRLRDLRESLRSVWIDILTGGDHPVNDHEGRLRKAAYQKAGMSPDTRTRLSRDRADAVLDAVTGWHLDDLFRDLAAKFGGEIPARVAVDKLDLVRIGNGRAEVEMPDIPPKPLVKTAYRTDYATGFDGFHQLIGAFSASYPDREIRFSVFSRFIPRPFWQYTFQDTTDKPHARTGGGIAEVLYRSLRGSKPQKDEARRRLGAYLKAREESRSIVQVKAAIKASIRRLANAEGVPLSVAEIDALVDPKR